MESKLREVLHNAIGDCCFGREGTLVSWLRSPSDVEGHILEKLQSLASQPTPSGASPKGMMVSDARKQEAHEKMMATSPTNEFDNPAVHRYIKETVPVASAGEPSAQLGGTIGLDGDTKREELVCRRHDVYYDPENKLCVICDLRAKVAARATAAPASTPASREQK